MPKQSNHYIHPSELDARGRVAIWLIAQGRWSWRHPIDAREIVGMGAGSFTAPEGAPPKPSPDSPHGGRLDHLDRRAEEADNFEADAQSTGATRTAAAEAITAARSGKGARG